MDKPQTLVYEEFKNGIAGLINNSGLPFFVIESVLKDFLIEVREVSKQQCEYDKQQYEHYLSTQNQPQQMEDNLAEDDIGIKKKEE